CATLPPDVGVNVAAPLNTPVRPPTGSLALPSPGHQPMTPEGGGTQPAGLSRLPSRTSPVPASKCTPSAPPSVVEVGTARTRIATPGWQTGPPSALGRSWQTVQVPALGLGFTQGNTLSVPPEPLEQPMPNGGFSADPAHANDDA